MHPQIAQIYADLRLREEQTHGTIGQLVTLSRRRLESKSFLYFLICVNRRNLRIES